MGFQTFFFFSEKKTHRISHRILAWSAPTWSYCHIAPHLHDLEDNFLWKEVELLNPKVFPGELTFSQFETRVKTKKHLQNVIKM